MKTLTLQEVATIHGGGRLGLTGNDFLEQGVPAYGAGGQNGFLNVAEYYRPGIVLSSIGARCGKCFYADGQWTTLANTQVILPDLDRVHPRYLWYQLNDELRWPRSGTGQPFIKPADVKAHQIVLPALDEQRRIAAILDQADAIRAKRRQVLAHLDDLTQSIFHDMFGDLALDGTSIDDVADVQGGLQVSSKRASSPIEVPYLRVANVRRGRLDLAELKTLRATEREVSRTSLLADDLLFVEGHADSQEVGRVAVWSGEIDPCVHQNHLIRGRLDQSRALPTFAATWLNTDRGAAHFRRASKTTSGLNTISTSTVRSAPLPGPPLSQQNEFASRVQQIGERQATVRRALAADNELFASLQSRAFQGEL